MHSSNNKLFVYIVHIVNSKLKLIINTEPRDLSTNSANNIIDNLFFNIVENIIKYVITKLIHDLY